MKRPLHTGTGDQVSLARLLSKFGFASRSQAGGLIAEGRVRVNGQVVRSTARRVNPRTDRVSVDGDAVHARKFVYVALHKPVGLVTSRADEHGRSTVYKLLSAGERWMFPVGRLDKETSGLLLFTNDTRWGEGITSPGSGITKTYRAHLDAPLSEAHRRVMEAGMVLEDGERLLPATVRSCDGGFVAEVTLREGRNRQVRRMFAQLGYAVTALHRIRIGPVALGALASGQSRPLRPEEVAALRVRSKEGT